MVLEAVIKGDTVEEVLGQVECDAGILLGKLRPDVDTAVREGVLTTKKPAGLFASTKTA